MFSLIRRAFIDVRWRLGSRVDVLYARGVGLVVGTGTLLNGRPIVTMAERSQIMIGERGSLCSVARGTALGVNHPIVLRTLTEGGCIRIGDDVGLSGTTIRTATRITIGDRVLVRANVTIADTNFHPVHQLPRRYAPVPWPEPYDAIVIEDDVFLGTGSIVLASVTIGRGAVVGSPAVVTRDVAPLAIVAGNPTRVVGKVHLNNEEG